jgi:sulfur-oxidizing protein SoxB
VRWARRRTWSANICSSLRHQARHGIEAHAFTYLNFEKAAKTYGKVGGFAHLATLVKRLRAGRARFALLLDGGDTWQGSATALWTKGQDMVDACKLLGVDVMMARTGSSPGRQARAGNRRKGFQGQDRLPGPEHQDHATSATRCSSPTHQRNERRAGGRHRPGLPLHAHRQPGYMVSDWTFGIQDDNMQKMVDEARGKGAQAVVVISHNGMDVDLKMASRVTGIDAILGGHTRLRRARRQSARLPLQAAARVCQPAAGRQGP